MHIFAEHSGATRAQIVKAVMKKEKRNPTARINHRESVDF
jgi:hypothetical protein